MNYPAVWFRPTFEIDNWDPVIRNEQARDIAEKLSGYRYVHFSIDPTNRVVLRTRWWPRFASSWDVAKDEVTRPAPFGICEVYYSIPQRCPSFLTVNYLRCGERTSYSTLLRAVKLTEFIASQNQLHAIVCQAISRRLSERLLNRWGYVRHAAKVGSNHFIRRLG